MSEKYQKITVGGFLVVDHKVLVVRRSENNTHFVGYYELPGGKVDFGEHPEASLKREFKEEVNLRVKAKQVYRIFTYTFGDRHTVEIVYLVELDDDVKNLRLSEEHDDFKWIKPSEMAELKISDEIKTNILEGFKLIKK